ncbi:4-hydroxy-tetrahydrodipicolinate synthase [Candidatus Vidania fulgoroideorum]
MKLNKNIVSIITPMKKNGNIDFDDFTKIIKFQLKKNTKFILVSGTTGECSTLKMEEKLKLVDLVKFYTKNIVVGSSYNSTEKTIHFLKNAKIKGARYCLLNTPYYNTNLERNILNYFNEVFSNTKIPIILYDIPNRTGVKLSIKTIKKISKIKGVLGIKESCGDIKKEMFIKKYTKLDIYSGDDFTSAISNIIGAKGVISVISNIFPEIINKIFNCKFKDKIYIQKKIFKLTNLLFSETNPVPIKWLMYKIKMIKQPKVRSPLLILKKNKKKILNEYKKIKTWKKKIT